MVQPHHGFRSTRFEPHDRPEIDVIAPPGANSRHLAAIKDGVRGTTGVRGNLSP
jgi:hypothetical protein